MSNQPIIIGVAGGTGSGKTTVAMRILEQIGAEHIAYIPHDVYYRDLAHMPPMLRAKVNFDHPDSLENDLLVQHLRALKAGQAVDVPIYDFTTHRRTGETRCVGPAAVVLVEGILVFVEPSKRYADVIIPEGGFNEVAIEMVAARIRGLLGQERSALATPAGDDGQKAFSGENGVTGQPPHNASIAGRTIRGSLYSVGASVVTLLLGFLRSVFLARLLLPEHFGVVALGLFYIGLAGRLRGFDLDAGLIHRQDAGEALFETFFTLRFGLELLATVLLLGAIPLLRAAYPDMPALPLVMPALIAVQFLASTSQIQETLLRKKLIFSKLAVTDIAASVTMTVVALYLAWRGWGIWALVAEQASGIVARFFLVWGPFRQRWPTFGWDRQQGRWFWAYGRSAWLASNLTYLLDQFDDFWVGTGLGKTPLGYYSKSYEFARYPRRVVANPLVSVVGPVFARLQGDRLRLSRLFYRSAHLILRTGLLAVGGFALVLPEFIHLAIGDKWLPMLWTFRLMLVYAMLDPLLMLVGNLMLATGQPKEMQRARLVQAAFFVPAVIIGSRLWGINGVALAADGMLLLGAWRLYRPLRRIVDFSLSRLVLWPLLAFTLAWGGGLVVEWAIRGTWQAFLLKIAVFLAIFGGFLLGVERGDYVKAARSLWAAMVTERASPQ